MIQVSNNRLKWINKNKAKDPRQKQKNTSHHTMDYQPTRRLQLKHCRKTHTYRFEHSKPPQWKLLTSWRTSYLNVQNTNDNDKDLTYHRHQTKSWTTTHKLWGCCPNLLIILKTLNILTKFNKFPFEKIWKMYLFNIY